VTDPKPKLVAVDSETDTASTHKPRPQRRRWSDPGIGFWLLAIFLAVAAAMVAVQTRRAGRLSVQVENLEADLGVAQGALRTYESRFGEIRESVGDLRTQLAALEVLVGQPAPSTSNP